MDTNFAHKLSINQLFMAYYLVKQRFLIGPEY